MIPALDSGGFLPEGIHDCTLEEAQNRFGRFQVSDRRPQLWGKLQDFLRQVNASPLVERILLDGSFVTGKPDPNDIDLILVVPATHDLFVELRPSEYNLLSKRRVFQRHGFDVLVARSGSEEYWRYVSFFQNIRFQPGRKKGILGLMV